jgi:hypothetical protein
VAATSFTVVSDTQITTVSPAQAASTRNIFVTAPGGTSATVAGDKFTYTTSGSGGVVGTSLIPAGGPPRRTARALTREPRSRRESLPGHRRRRSA